MAGRPFFHCLCDLLFECLSSILTRLPKVGGSEKTIDKSVGPNKSSWTQAILKQLTVISGYPPQEVSG